MASAQLIETAEGSLERSVLLDLLASQRRLSWAEAGSQSRSTSASSRSSSHHKPSAAFGDLSLDFEYPLPVFKPFNATPLPCRAPPPTPGMDVDLECDVALFVKNTFIVGPVDGPTSLDGFLQHRQIHSCPPGAVAAEPEPEPSQAPGAQEPGSEAPYEPLQTPFPSQVWERTPEPESAVPSPLQQSAAPLLQLVAMAPPPPPPATWAPAVRPEVEVPPPPMAPGEQPAMVVRLAETMGLPALGSPDVPTLGSLGHRYGTCKPCAFMHTKGCTSGVDCEFCHLCDKNERKRRQKQKHQQAARQQLLEQQGPWPQEPLRSQPLRSQPQRSLPLRVTSAAR